MNIYTVAKASQGLADYLKKHHERPSVAIGYDSRIKSDLFAKIAAGVFAANGIKVNLWPVLMPVPTVSFAVRCLHTSAGVMITASHNPSKYNGYKVYGADGCQITTEAAAEILAEIEKLDIFADVKTGDFEAGVADGSIQFDHVTFKYKHGSGQPVLNDISFTIQPGETLGIIGGTGSAKSSLVQLIPRLYDAETGSVKVGGVDVKDYSLDVLRREVSMVLQKNVLFSGTILDNLRWGDENASEEECIRVAKLACADEFIERFPDKYNTWIEQGGSNVSGGQKQRLTIARALLRKPKVLILDDSTSAVDTATDAKIRKAFREEIPGTTKIIIAQRISSVQDADRILVLDNGRIDGLGTHEELLKTNAIYQEVYSSQTQGGGDFDKQGGEQ